MSDTLRTPVNALEYFALLVSEEASLPLPETVSNIAQIENSSVTLADIEDKLDILIRQTQQKIATDTPVLQKIWQLNQFFYKELGFQGTYGQPENIDQLCINQVLETRRGTDILLAIIYIEIAQNLNLQARGVIFPERFLIKIRLSRPNGAPAEVIIDPTNGKSLNMDDIHTLLGPFKKNHGLVDEFDIPCDLFLESATRKEIIASILWQIRSFYLEHNDWPHLIQTLDRLIILQPESIENYRERGYALIKLGRPQQAIIDLEHYLQHAHTQLIPDEVQVQQQLDALRNPHMP